VKERLELYSHFPPEECVRRLSAAIDVERSLFRTWASLTGKRPVAGWVKDSSFRLRKRITYNNGFQTYLTGTLQPRDAGTLIGGEFGLNALTRLFIPLWFGFLFFFMGVSYPIVLISLFKPHPAMEHTQDTWPFLVVPPGMLLFGYLLIRFGRYLARDEAGFLSDFLRQTLEARELPAGSPPPP
jgi:hypothetical protein